MSGEPAVSLLPLALLHHRNLKDLGMPIQWHGHGPPAAPRGYPLQKRRPLSDGPVFAYPTTVLQLSIPKLYRAALDFRPSLSLASQAQTFASCAKSSFRGYPAATTITRQGRFLGSILGQCIYGSTAGEKSDEQTRKIDLSGFGFLVHHS